jgi:predicted ester cyclase
MTVTGTGRPKPSHDHRRRYGQSAGVPDGGGTVEVATRNAFFVSLIDHSHSNAEVMACTEEKDYYSSPDPPEDRSSAIASSHDVATGGGRAGDEDDMTAEQNKLLVQRLVQEAVNLSNLDALAEVADGEFAQAARQWIGPFRTAFPDFSMEIVDLVAEEEKVAAHFRCSGTHLGEWLGRPPSGRRFQDVDEIYIFRVSNGKLVAATGVEDNLSRMRQLGLES